MKRVYIKEETFEEARKKIREAKKVQGENVKVIFSSGDDELNRKIIEKEPIDILLINLSQRKDRIKQRDSGFNQVLARLAKKRGIVIGINFDEFIEEKLTKEKSKMLSRIRQNIMLCKKNGVKMDFISRGNQKRDSHELKALGLVLGMPTWMIKDL